jgi:hypothetical protein
MPVDNKTYDEASMEAIADASDVPSAVVDAAEYAGFNDASETMVFARQLETIKNRIYEKKYPELKGRQFVPFSMEGGDASEFITYRFWDTYTMAKIVSNYATDFPLVSASATEVTMKYYDIGNGYSYSIKDMRQAARAGVPLSDKLAMAARRGIELGIDDAVAVGVPTLRTYGLINNPNVPILTVTTGTWASATGEQMLDDLNSIVTQMYANSSELFEPDTMLMSTNAFRKISTKLLSAANASGDTVLSAFLRQNPGMKVASWVKLNTANATATNGRIVAYKRDPEVVEFEMGKEFEVFPPEQRGLTLTHACMARVAGVAVHHSLGIAYVDNQTM